MAANTSLTDTAINTGYTQLLHVGDTDGVDASTNRVVFDGDGTTTCLLYTSPSPRDKRQSRMPSSA